MKGKQHAILGGTATFLIAITLIIIEGFSYIEYIPSLLFGGILGSYMPDIDIRNSFITKLISKIISSLIILIILATILDIPFNRGALFTLFINFVHKNSLNETGIALFSILIFLGKISPHRMFTHKWLGTSLFILSSCLIGSIFFTIGFSTGYILHLIADGILTNSKPLKFLEFKLPCKNSKNKFSISW